MKLKTPEFWYQGAPSLWPVLLTPLSWGYLLGHCINQALQNTRKADIPVICVGNPTAGGSGKTPTAIALTRLIKEQKLATNPVFLTRGYGGDEDQILSQYAPVIINENRYQGALEAQNQGADLIIMDDGFQNQGLCKDLNILVMNGHDGIGNGQLLPAGPLREPLKDALSRTDIIVIIGPDETNTLKKIPAHLPVIKADIHPGDIDLSQKYLAFAGLARPHKFEKTLRKMGANITEFIAYPDHYAYRKSDYDGLIQKAEALEARLITTEKDTVKLKNFDHDGKVQMLPISVSFEDNIPLMTKIKEILMKEDL